MKKHEAIIRWLEFNVSQTERYLNDPNLTAWQKGNPVAEARLSEARYILRQIRDNAAWELFNV